MDGDRLKVWSHTQGIFGLRQEMAMVLRLPEETSMVHHVEGAGCYGHNGADDVRSMPALIARVAKDGPVRVQWTREDESPGSRTAGEWSSRSTRSSTSTAASSRGGTTSGATGTRTARGARQTGADAAGELAQPFRARAGGRSTAALRRRAAQCDPGL